MNKGKKKTMFNKRKTTTGGAGTNSNKGSFKGDDPFNKILYADRSRDMISNNDISVSSKQPDTRQKSIISLQSSNNSSIQKSPSGAQ